MTETSIRENYPFDNSFYSHLLSRREEFELVKEQVVTEGGYAFYVGSGQTFRFALPEGPQILDVCFYNAQDPSEHYAAGTQLAVEGGCITRLTRIWGTPPRSRPLCTCVADTVRFRDNPANARDHSCHGAHCNPHHWLLYAGYHPQTCYDNLRAALSTVGLTQRHIHDNANLFQKTAIDPHTGGYVLVTSDATREDYIEFYAEIALLIVISLCPYGDGTVEPVSFGESDIPIRPLRVEIRDTQIASLAWEDEVARWSEQLRKDE